MCIIITRHILKDNFGSERQYIYNWHSWLFAEFSDQIYIVFIRKKL